MTAQEIFNQFSETLLQDERILSMRERELLASVLQHARVDSNTHRPQDAAISEAISRAVGETVAQRAFALLGSQIVRQVGQLEELPGLQDAGYRITMGPTPPVKGPTPPHKGPTPPVKGPTPPLHGPTPPVKGPTPPLHGPTPPVKGPTPPLHGPTPPVKGPTPPLHGPTPPVKGPTPPLHGPTPPVKGPTPPLHGPTPPVKGPTPPLHGPTPPVKGPTPPLHGPTPPVKGPTPPLKGPTPPTAQTQPTRVAVMEEATILPSQCVVLDEFLVPEELTRLTQYTLEHEPDFEVSKVISPGVNAGTIDYEARRSLVLMNQDEQTAVITQRIQAFLPRILQKLGRASFPVSQVEAQITATNQGDFFQCHSDNCAEEISSRELTFVYFFHQEPKAFQGGELRIYDSQLENGQWVKTDNYQMIVPEQNRIVFFPSSLVHEITPVECPSEAFADSRFTVNGWFHR